MAVMTLDIKESLVNFNQDLEVLDLERNCGSLGIINSHLIDQRQIYIQNTRQPPGKLAGFNNLKIYPKESPQFPAQSPTH